MFFHVVICSEKLMTIATHVVVLGFRVGMGNDFCLQSSVTFCQSNGFGNFGNFGNFGSFGFGNFGSFGFGNVRRPMRIGARRLDR